MDRTSEAVVSQTSNPSINVSFELGTARINIEVGQHGEWTGEGVSAVGLLPTATRSRVQRQIGEPRPAEPLGPVPVPGRSLSEVPDDEGGPEWLWDGRLPCGALVGIEGDPCLGKSSLTLDLAARLSTGAPMPFESTTRNPAGVVLANAEDPPRLVKARARAAGIDTDRVRILTGSECGGLLGDLVRLEAAIMSVQAKLVVVDPLMSALGGGTNARVDQSVRKELSPLGDLADRLGVSILVVRHLTKGSGGNDMYRGSGTIGLTGAFRSLLAVSKRPERPDEQVVRWVKNNWGAMPNSLTYRIVSAGKVGRVEWLEEVVTDSE